MKFARFNPVLLLATLIGMGGGEARAAAALQISAPAPDSIKSAITPPRLLPRSSGVHSGRSRARPTPRRARRWNPKHARQRVKHRRKAARK